MFEQTTNTSTNTAYKSYNVACDNETADNSNEPTRSRKIRQIE